MPSLLLSNPLGADDAQRIGLEIRAYPVGEVISVNDYVFATLLRTGYGIPYGTAEEILLVGDGSPTEATGVDGQWYLDKLNEVLWGPKIGGEWPSDPIRPDRGVQQLRVENYELIITYSTGTEVNLGNIRGPAGPAPVAATTTQQGVVRLAGDFGGTADNPTVPGLADRIPLTQRGAASGVATLGADSKVPIAQLPAGTASGVASLDNAGKLPVAQLPDLAVTEFLGSTNSQAAMLALVGQRGDWTVRTDLGTTWIVTAEPSNVIGSWTQLSYPTAPVTTVAGKAGAVTLVSADITDATAAATANMVAKRDASGRIAVAAPNASGDAANRTYVDAADLAYRRIAVKTIADAAYTFLTSDEGSLVGLTGSNARTFTVPTNATAAIPVGGWIDVQQQGTGSLSITGAAGVTLYNTSTGATGTVTLPGTYARVRLHKTATNAWMVSGDLVPSGRWVDLWQGAANLNTMFAADGNNWYPVVSTWGNVITHGGGSGATSPTVAGTPLIPCPAGYGAEIEFYMPIVTYGSTNAPQFRLRAKGVTLETDPISLGANMSLYLPARLRGVARANTDGSPISVHVEIRPGGTDPTYLRGPQWQAGFSEGPGPYLRYRLTS